MATRAVEKVEVGPRHAVYKWENLTTTDADGEWLEIPDFPNRSVQVIGTQGSGGDLDIEGSNDGGTNAAPLNDLDGNAISVGAPDTMHMIRENTRAIRPNVSGGDGTTDYDVWLYAWR